MQYETVINEGTKKRNISDVVDETRIQISRQNLNALKIPYVTSGCVS